MRNNLSFLKVYKKKTTKSEVVTQLLYGDSFKKLVYTFELMPDNSIINLLNQKYTFSIKNNILVAQLNDIELNKLLQELFKPYLSITAMLLTYKPKHLLLSENIAVEDAPFRVVFLAVDIKCWESSDFERLDLMSLQHRYSPINGHTWRPKV